MSAYLASFLATITSIINKELEQMCNKEKLKLTKHDNINPKAHINKSKVHLNRNGYLKLGKNFANFINNNA